MAPKIKYKTIGEYIKARTIVDTNGCWIWMGPLKTGVYPYAYGYWRGKTVAVHRLSYGYFNKGIDELKPGLTVHHICNNPRCVNPSHLKQCTIQENLSYRDYSVCRRGHEMTGGNRIVRINCRKCYELRRKKTLERRHEKNSSTSHINSTCILHK